MKSHAQHIGGVKTEFTTTGTAGYSLTRGQELIWLGQQLSPDKPLYNMVFTFEFNRHIDYQKFKQAFAHTVKQNEGLRNLFGIYDQSPRQYIVEQLDYEFKLVEFDTDPDPIASSQTWIDQQKLKKLQLNECCFDSHLLKLSEQHYIWYLNQHHLITDVWSASLVFKSVVKAYFELEQQLKPSADSTLPIRQYHQFEHQYRQQHGGIDTDESTPHKPVAFHFYGRSFQADEGKTKRLKYVFNAAQDGGLRTLAASKNIAGFSQALTQFNIYLTVLCAYLNRVSNLSTVTIGVPVHNRTQRTHQKMIGLFIELFPVTVDIDDKATFEDLYKSVSAASQALLQQAGPGLSTGEMSKQFNVVLNYIHIEFDNQHSIADKIQWVHCDYSDPAHALRVHICQFDTHQPAHLLFDINQALWQNALQPDIAAHFMRLLDAFISNPTQQFSKVDLSSDQDKAFLLTEYNKLPGPPGQSKIIIELFRQSVSNQPHRTAVIDDGQTYSYAEVDKLSNRLCAELISADISSGDLVGIHLQRSIELIVAILAVLKTGAAYIPLEQNLPKARIDYIANQSGLKLILTEDHLSNRLTTLNLNFRPINLHNLASMHQDPYCPRTQVDHSHTAYVMYTSGSTGQPKGVIISHQALYAYISWAIKHYIQDQAKVFPLHSSIGFDLTVTSIFVPLCSGGTIRTYKADGHSIDLSIIDVIEENEVDIVKLTPAHLELIDTEALASSRIQAFIVGGEDFKTTLAKRIHTRFDGNIKLFNEYGPTEATVGCMIHQFNPAIDHDHSVPIGIPAEHTRIYLLDDGLNPLPNGVTGEIYISGCSLAEGYLNHADLTAESFLQDPFYPDRKMYKTGDLARFGENNKLVYLSRKDDQYKIRGIRVEKAEIENALNQHPQINACHLSYLKAESIKFNEIKHCERCGIASNYPNLRFDQNGVCNLCLEFQRYHDKAQQYFSNMDDLHQLLQRHTAKKTGDYDCLMLLSGGKDSTYALYQLSLMGLSIYAMTLDNGFISDSAKTNISRTVKQLGIDHEFATTSAMNDIFAESLKLHCSVCYGCFKTIYTLALRIAKDKGIPCIVTGLSRGQFFETRLTKESFDTHRFDPAQIDNEVLNARKIYHRINDTVTQRIAGDMFNDDTIFEQISFVDFYRYCDVSLSEIYRFLEHEVPWIRPEDTGRSTNCLINDTGIYYHKQLQGYHNYALPYSWDVRLGLKTRQQAMDELDDVIDVRSVIDNLKKIGITETDTLTDAQSDALVMYYVSERQISSRELRDFLSQHLVTNIIPRYFIRLKELPLTVNGKIDNDQLPDPKKQSRNDDVPLIQASTSHEKTLASIFSQVLQHQKISIHDNYFDLGGDSIKAIQIAAQAGQFGLKIKPGQMFDHQTIKELATVISNDDKFQASQSAIEGVAELTPIQRWFFKQPESARSVFNHSVHLELNKNIPAEQVQLVINKLIEHHDALRHCYTSRADGLKQSVTAELTESKLKQIVANDEISEQLLAETEQALHQSININNGPLIACALITGRYTPKSQLILVIHHLAVDAVSWQILLDDFDLLVKQIHLRQELLLPLKTTAFLDWANFLSQYKNNPIHTTALEKLPDVSQHHPVIVRAEQPAKTETVFDTYVMELPQALCQRLTTKPAIDDKKIPLHKTLLAGLAYCLSKFCKQDSLCINVESHGRYDLDEQINITRTLGWFTSINPICLTVKSGVTDRPLKDLIKQIDDQSELVFHRFIDSQYAAIDQTDFYSNVLFNYFGQHLTGAYQEFFITRPLAFTRSKQTQLQHAIELNIFDSDQSLRIECSYDPAYVFESTLSQLLDQYLVELESLCVNTNTKTANNFNIDSLTDSDLAAIQRQLK